MTISTLTRAAGTALLALGLHAAPALAGTITFDVESTSGFSDPVTGSEPFGYISGWFDFTDGNGNSIIEAGEISAFSLTSTGFANSLLNFSLDSSSGFISSASSFTPVDIGGGVMADSITFATPVMGYAVGIDFAFGSVLGGPLPEINLFHAFDPTFAYPYASASVTPRIDPVPLPAGLPLLAGGLGLFGLIRRQRARG